MLGPFCHNFLCSERVSVKVRKSAPKMRQLRGQVEPKIGSKTNQKFNHILHWFFDRFFIDLGWVLSPNLGPSWVQNGTQETIQEQLAKKQKIKKTIVSSKIKGSRPPRWGQNPPKIDQTPIKNGINFVDWFLDRFFIDFGSILEPTWPSRSSQNRSKIDQKRD